MNIINAMVIEQEKMMNQPAVPIEVDLDSCPVSAAPNAAAKPTAPYANTGGKGETADKCHVHVIESENCKGDKDDLSAEVTIWDAAGKQIGYHSSAQAGATNPLPVSSKLENPLVLTTGHRHDYIQFGLGLQKFTSQDHDKTAHAWCNTGGWDPKQGPVCRGRYQQKPSDSVRRASLPNNPYVQVAS